jgi:uncharacterized membrane protein
MMDGGMMGGMTAAWGIWAFLVILTLVAVLVVAVLASVWLVRKLREDEHSPMASGIGESAYEALRRRYATGEIDDEEYERRLAVLNRRRAGEACRGSSAAAGTFSISSTRLNASTHPRRGHLL